jgi:hypothetical protein
MKIERFSSSPDLSPLFILTRIERLLRCQAGETEIDFFPDIQQQRSDQFSPGNMSISNLRVIWYSSENASQNICLPFVMSLQQIIFF